MSFNYELFERDNYSRLAVGIIKEVNMSPRVRMSDDNRVEDNRLYRTATVEWQMGLNGVSDNVPIPSGIHSEGYGIDIIPCKGDVVICGAYNDKTMQILVVRSAAISGLHGIMDGTDIVTNSFGDVTKADNASMQMPVRYISQGEISIISKGQSEIFLDNDGTCRLIIRDKDTNWQNGDRTDKYPHQFLGDRLWELAVGRQIKDEATGDIERTDDGKDKQVVIHGYGNGLDLGIDSDGNISYGRKDGYTAHISANGDWDISSPDRYAVSMRDGRLSVSIGGNELLSIDASSVKIGREGHEPAVLGNTLEGFLKNLVTTFNTHTHTSTAPGTPTTPPMLQAMPPQGILSGDVKVSK